MDANVSAERLAVMLGQWLKSERAEQGMDQSELATLAGVSRATVSRMERGQSVASHSLFRLMAQLQALDDISLLVEDNYMSTQQLKRKITGRRNRQRRHKWEAFCDYWSI
ncbi:helix-turn-helix transcriptional regulator [Pseudidiomarina insulisalsae]|uniref:HTH cro/C1-type domain-containing protein n=1 Tax=Pseudidiomarina insulisalsae TaxID=575789 RepID=A0A432YMN7_9GAMM|nr:helix-turn-helix transcriptional regulator [Pseudidiomarina insulisalsae]RUO62203.1 hypothetical protein CWI71_04960 [Pseudidiomarina insulisalsae]